MLSKKEEDLTPIHERNFLNLIKILCEKSSLNIPFNRERLNALPLRLGTGQECPLSQLLFSIILEVLDNELRQEKWIKDILFYLFILKFFNTLFTFESERRGGGTEREKNRRSEVDSALTEASPMRGSNSQTMRSWPELMLVAQPTEPPRCPTKRNF